MKRIVICIYDDVGGWVQEKYQYQGLDDIGWTSDPQIILKWLKEEIEK